MKISKIDESINYCSQDHAQQRNAILNPGDKIGEGFGGVVYQDMDDPHKVIKEIQINNSYDIDAAIKEYNLFKRYYGEASAFIHHEGNYCYLQMDKLPGDTIDKIETFPSNAEEFFINMLKEMEAKGIYHADLKPDNVLYCAKENRFYPIDFSDTGDLRRTANNEEYRVIDKEYQCRINTILDVIGNRAADVSRVDEEPTLGRFIGSGTYGSVYLDNNNESFVFKRFSDNGKKVVEQAKIEASNFNRFYGAHSAEVIIHNENIYIKMLRVPGVALEDIPKGNLSREAEYAFYNFLSCLARSKIMHDDLFECNIHYDHESNKFYPIDIGNQYYDYFDSDRFKKDGYNFLHHRRNEEIIASIRSKIS